MSTRTVYGRSILAVLVPAVVAVVLTFVDLDPTFDVLLQHHTYLWLTVVSSILLVARECQYVSTLAILLRRGGRASAVCVFLDDPAERLRRRRWRFRMVAMTCAAIMGFLFAEIVFRAFNIRPPAPAPSPYDEARLVNNTRNVLGLREPWDALAEDDHRLRIAFLGDSITYGESVEHEQTFCQVVERFLTDAVPQGVVTINISKPGSCPGEQLGIYRRVRDPLRPDLVVHVIYPNDLNIGLADMLKSIYRVRDDDLIVGDSSYVLCYAERQIRYWVAWKRTIAYFHGGRDKAEQDASWVRFKHDVADCKAAVEEGGATYAMVLFPWLVRLDDYMLTDVHRKIGEFASELGVPYLDLLEAFVGRDGAALRISPANEHPNTEGHRLAAERIARFLREDVLPHEAGTTVRSQDAGTPKTIPP